VPEVHGRFSHQEYELAALFQDDIGRTEQEIVRVRGRDSRYRLHGTGATIIPAARNEPDEIDAAMSPDR
jgi:hypothetical protein